MYNRFYSNLNIVVGFASRRVAAASPSLLLLLMPLPAASSPRHAFNWLLVNGVFRKVCIIVHGAVPKRGETLPDSAKMLLLFGRMAACTAIINGCAPDFYLGFWALRKA